MIFVASEQVLNRVALNRAGDDNTWLAFVVASFIERRQDFIQIMAIDFLGEPAKRFEFRRQRPKVENLRSGPGLLIAILVNDRGQIIELELVRGHDRFTNLALIYVAGAGPHGGYRATSSES